MLAVIKTGGKQYKVKEGDTLKIEKIAGEEGGSVLFTEVLLISDEDGTKVNLGAPLLEGAEVSAKILEQGRAKKVSVVKYKPKTRYKRNVGHRQPFTKVQIESINEKSAKAEPKKVTEEKK
ncbi:MAG: 50S ribosomal protein L21 [Parcubacteria group bacterium]|nr:50S ribosomal protein L21 [Parcubacteria group bacterium]